MRVLSCLEVGAWQHLIDWHFSPSAASHQPLRYHFTVGFSSKSLSMDRLNRMLASAGGMGGLNSAAPGSVSSTISTIQIGKLHCHENTGRWWTTNIQDNSNLIDNSETVYISSLALLKMLRHGRAGVPMEVMGLMLGEFVDDFTVRVVDVFAMPQSGTGVSVEAVDPVFQTKMMDMLRQTGRCVYSSCHWRAHELIF